jgi:ABC-type branched-subunit amino acid transport system ATPase component
MGILSTEGLQKRYKGTTVVNGVDINVNAGEVVGLLGPNGAGKTTCFYMIVGLVKPNKGSIWLDDIDITSMPMHKRARLGIGYLPQEASVAMPWASAFPVASADALKLPGHWHWNLYLSCLMNPLPVLTPSRLVTFNRLSRS